MMKITWSRVFKVMCRGDIMDISFKRNYDYMAMHVAFTRFVPLAAFRQVLTTSKRELILI